MRMLNTAIVVAALACAGAATAPAATPEAAGNDTSASFEALGGQLREAYRDGDAQGAASLLRRMLAYRPYSGDLLYRLAAAYAKAGDRSGAYEALLLLQKQGLAADPADDQAFQKVRDTKAFEFIAEQLAANGEPFNHAPVAFRSSESLPWPAAIAHDPESGRFYVAGLRSGRILAVAPDGSAEELLAQGADGGPAGISALALDAERGVLWAAGTEVRLDEGGALDINTRAARLYGVEVKSGEVRASYGVGGERELPHLFNEIAVAPDGAVFLSDALSPLVLVREPDGGELAPFVGSGSLTSLQGLTLDDSGRYLFVADWHTGIYRIRRDTREVTRVEAAANFNLGGIHGLTFHDGDLIAVQTGTRPHRVVRFMLSEDMSGVTGQQPLSANQPEYKVPGLGVVADGGFYFIANSGWGLFQRPAAIEAEPAVVLRADPELGMEQRLQMQRNQGVRVKQGGPVDHAPPASVPETAGGDDGGADEENGDGSG